MPEWQHDELHELGTKMNRVIPDLVRRKGKGGWQELFESMAQSERQMHFPLAKPLEELAEDFRLSLPVLYTLKGRRTWSALLNKELDVHPLNSAMWSWQGWLTMHQINLALLTEVLILFGGDAPFEKVVSHLIKQMAREHNPGAYHPWITGAIIGRIIAESGVLTHRGVWLTLLQEKEAQGCSYFIDAALAKLRQQADLQREQLLHDYRAHLFQTHVA